MVTKDTTEQVLWMADCYSLAKRFPNPHTWLALLEPVETVNYSPFHYWLWMEIWKAAQLNDKSDLATEAKAVPKPKLAARQAAKCRT
ncbi:MAG: hypothetical protein KGS72_00535 [Cyanobacteria bacterium REEB67]|jgi:hypothetical protein|nr:hypothetical protein [Cyanobacteria bacterium REEB67]